MSLRVVQAQFDEEWRRTRQLVEEYVASLKMDLSFENIAYELEHLPLEYASPTGAFFLAEENGCAVGCVRLRRFAEGVGEIKRPIQPPPRGVVA